MKRSHSLKKNADIEAVLAYKRAAHTAHFSVYKKPKNQAEHYRVAFSVPKKFGNAVKRNQMKRRLRAIFDQLTIQGTDDVFVLVRPKAKDLTFAQIENDIKVCLNKQKLIEEVFE